MGQSIAAMSSATLDPCSGSDIVGTGPTLKLDRDGGRGRGSDARLWVDVGKVW